MCLGQRPGARPRQSGVPQPRAQGFPSKVDLRWRAKVDLWIRRIQMIYCVIDGAIHFKFFRLTIHGLAVIVYVAITTRYEFTAGEPAKSEIRIWEGGFKTMRKPLSARQLLRDRGISQLTDCINGVEVKYLTSFKLLIRTPVVVGVQYLTTN